MLVSVPCLGTMTFGWEPQDWGSTEAASLKVLSKALDLGINFFDTANAYGRGSSETILGKGLKGVRDRVVIASKCHFKMSDDDPNASGNSRRHVIQACEDSLRRLDTDWIDLYQLHRPQPSVPIDETLRALDDLVRSGKVRYVGCSTFAAWQVCEALYVAKELGAAAFVSEQPPYNLLDRRAERELMPLCRTYDIAVIPWSPLAGGMLTGKYLEGKPKGARYTSSDPFNRLHRQGMQTVRRLGKAAERNGLSLMDLALGWVTSQPGVTSPIIGARSPKQLEEAVRACQTPISERAARHVDLIVPSGTHVIDYYTANFGPNVRPYS